jgi:hypothetical protein
MRCIWLPGSLVLLLGGRALAQAPLAGENGILRLNGFDMAILETQEVRKDLPCTVEPVKPVLGFDLRFHGGYGINIPLKDIAGPENQLTILFRVTPKSRKDDPAYFVQYVPVPKIEENSKGEAELSGSFDLGEGSYHVDLLMRDRAERVCSFYWEPEAVLEDRDKQIGLAIRPNTVERLDTEQFKEEPVVPRTPGKPLSTPLNIKILVNFAPQDQNSATLRPTDTRALVTVLRLLAREPQLGKFSLVAFNVQEERVFYRQSSAAKIDFPRLGEAIRAIQPGKIDLKRLAQKHGEVQFLTDLIKKEMTSSDHPDALIFAGPKVLLDDSVPDEELKPLVSDVDYPVFYLNYNLSPQSIPWRDSISKAIRPFRSAEFSINRPRDLWFAVTEVVSRIVKSKQGKATASSPSQ